MTVQWQQSEPNSDPLPWNAVWKVSLPDWNIPAVPIPLAGLWNFFTIHPLEDRYNLMAFGKRLVTELKRVGKKHTAERYSPEHC